jgi:hypothetical protein
MNQAQKALIVSALHFQSTACANDVTEIKAKAADSVFPSSETKSKWQRAVAEKTKLKAELDELAVIVSNSPLDEDAD